MIAQTEYEIAFALYCAGLLSEQNRRNVQRDLEISDYHREMVRLTKARTIPHEQASQQVQYTWIVRVAARALPLDELETGEGHVRSCQWCQPHFNPIRHLLDTIEIHPADRASFATAQLLSTINQPK